MKKFKTLAILIASFALAFPAAAGAKTVEIVALGDSLTAGLGLDPGQSFPEQLEAALKARGHDVTVANAGVSGDTASAGLARLEWSVPAEADIVIVELGANDAHRGIDPAVTRKALSDIVAGLSQRGQAVLLAGMFAPPNLGPAYAKKFNPIYPDLSAKYEVPLYPFFLAGVVTDATLVQPDGMHPNAAGVAKIVETILPDVEGLIAKVGAGD